MSVAVSELIKAKEEEAITEEGKIKTKSRDEWKKEKELEEARKAGTAPAAVDEEGRDINPHIPQYISAAPWYYSSKGPTLKHQRVQEDKVKEISTLNEWYQRGIDTTKISTKFRKGACENCGAMTHKKKDCLERPRKIGVKYTGNGFAPDEHAQPSLKLDFDGKRDRWNGYDPNEYLTIVSEFQKVEEAKRHLKAEKLKKGIEEGDLPDNMVLDEDVPEEDEDKYVEDADMPGTKVDSKQRITVRNLRIREDTAKYLRNLDPESAFYDPKTRAMRDNPYKNTGKSAEEVDYAGENFIRYTGDTNKHAKAQLFAWEAQHRGVDIDLMAEPTKLEILKKEFEKKKDEFKGALTESVIEKYGGKEHLEAPPRSLLLAQTEDYIEYSRQGKIIKGGEKQIIRSRYEEDVYPNNHSSIFGSFWREGHWGYSCCHSLLRNSYCTGDAGKEINDTSESLELAQQEQENRQQSKTLQEIQNKEKDDIDNEDEPTKDKVLSKSQKRNLKRKEAQQSKKGDDNKRKKRKGNESSSSSSSSSSGSSSSSSSSSESEDEEEVKKKKLKKALAEEEKRQKDADNQSDDRNRKYNSRYDIKAPTEEELEAYLMMRQREEDPMAHFK